MILEPGKQRVQLAFVGVVGANLEDTVFLIGRAVSRLAGRADSTKAAAIWIGVIFLIFLTIVLVLADQ